jgi:DNA-binding ferritin-like protein
MGDTSEREFSEKLVNIRSKSSKKTGEVIDRFGSMQKLKAESLKKTEEMMETAMRDLEKLEQDTVKSKDLAPESRQRLNADITTARAQIRQKYDELKTRIAAAIIP